MEQLVTKLGTNCDETTCKVEEGDPKTTVLKVAKEVDADLIIMLYRDSYYNEDSPDRDIAEVIVAKHRNGPTGTVKLIFQPELTKFLNLANSGNIYAEAY